MDSRSLIKLTIGGVYLLGSSVFPLLPETVFTVDSVLKAIVTPVGSVAAGNTANFIDALIDSKESPVSLQNHDLTKAVGKAIAAVILLAATQYRRPTSKYLEQIANKAKNNWVAIANQELTTQRYPELREAKLDEFLTPDEYALTQQGNLTVEEWRTIFIKLDAMADSQGHFEIPESVEQKVAESLHTNFPKALRETLKEDFKNEGKAFAGLTLQLLTGIKAEITQLQQTNTADLIPVLEHFEQMETQLRGTEAQQQALFQEISQQINSGFAEVCQQLGVIETNITQLLQSLGMTLQQLEENIADILSRLDPLNPQLSAAEWRIVTQKMLAERRTLTSNLLTRTEFNRVDLYVPLGLVERRKKESNPKQILKLEEDNQSLKRKEDTIIPIAEDEFFSKVLQHGQSSKSQGRRIAIIGEPGSGKTTRLQAIADWILENDLGLPIWIPLAEFTQPTLTHYLENIWLKQAGIRAGMASLMEQQNRIWFLFDGLDEMTARVESRHVSQLLTGWTGAGHAIVTCRVNVWEAEQNAFTGFDVFRNLPFEIEQVASFIQRFLGQPQSDSLIAVLHESGQESLRDLVRNPLQLMLLCHTWQQGEKLPETQANLYENYLKVVYGWNQNLQILRQQAKQCQINITNLKEQLNHQLGELAKRALNVSSGRFRLSQSLVEQYLGEEQDETSLCYLALRLGWLNRVGVDEQGRSSFAFYHATFQEYFAAMSIANWDYFLPRNHVDRPVAGKHYRVFEPSWKQVILFWLGRGDVADKEKESFIQALVEFKGSVRDFYDFRAYFLAAVGINQFRACSLANEIVKQIVKWAFDDFEQEDDFPLTFLEPIQDEARNIIPETIRELAISELISLVENHSDVNNFPDIAKSLSKIGRGNSRAIAALTHCLETTGNESVKDESIRLTLAESLGAIDPGSPQALAALNHLLKTTRNELILSRTINSLEKLGQNNHKIINSFIQIIKTSEDVKICEKAVVILSRIGQGNSDAIATLIQILVNPGKLEIRRKAASGLGKIAQGHPDAIAALVQILKTPENAKIHRRAAYSLSWIGQTNPDAIATLVKFTVTTESAYICRNILAKLKNIRERNHPAVTTLIKILKTSKNNDIREKAVETLDQISPGNPDAVAALIELIEKTDDEDTRDDLVLCLGDIGQGNSDVIMTLMKILEMTKDEWTRESTAQSLGRVDPGNPEAIATLVQIIQTTEDEDIRYFAALSLDQIDPGNPRAIATLVQIIQTTKDEDNCYLAALNLDQIDPGNSHAIATLVELLETSTNQDIHHNIILHLGQLKPVNQETITALVKLLKTTKNESTFKLATYILAWIGKGNLEVITTLINILVTTKNESNWYTIVDSVEEFLTNSEQYAILVFSLKNILKSQAQFMSQFEKYYEILWNCATQLSYPDFYQAWHEISATPHPEVEDVAPIGSTPLTQKYNLTLLPQLLSKACTSPQPICIDGSRFSQPKNPAPQIYITLKKAGCPPSLDGRPRTIADLQAYCEDDLTDYTIPIALILYEDPMGVQPQGFDIEALNALARFSYPPIAVVVPEVIPDCCLRQFCTRDSDLIPQLVQWLQS